MFEFWALPHQVEPQGDWYTWVMIGGRGAGKTRTGAEWIRALVEGKTPTEAGQYRHVALIGETIDQAREVMVFGESGILACSPPDRRPEWNGSRKTLTWPNGAMAWVMSATNSEALRGPQFDAAWLDELAKWKNAREAWDMLQFTLRLGEDPRILVTTSPRNQSLLREILEDDRTIASHAPTSANQVNLAPRFYEQLNAQYGGTRLGRQELDGELLAANADALWNLRQIDSMRLEHAPDLDRVVVAVDPPASSGENADACGIVVAGACTKGPVQDWRGYILADLTIENATPNQWAEVAVAAYEEYRADRIVAEVNQGGEMVESVLRQQSALIPYRAVHATRGKTQRAAPISALYEQGRIHHVGAFRTLEDQMVEMTFGGFTGKGSPDRVDALVWALTDLLVTPASAQRNPRVRKLY